MSQNTALESKFHKFDSKPLSLSLGVFSYYHLLSQQLCEKKRGYLELRTSPRQPLLVKLAVFF